MRSWQMKGPYFAWSQRAREIFPVFGGLPRILGASDGRDAFVLDRLAWHDLLGHFGQDHESTRGVRVGSASADSHSSSR